MNFIDASKLSLTPESW